MMEAVSAFALAASVECASALGAEPAHEPLRIAFVDCADLPATSVGALQSEARAILAPRGRDLKWRRVRPQHDLEPGEVPVILLAGEYPVRRSRGAVLGGVEPRAVRPAVWVYAPTVARAIGLTRPAATGDFAAQRALGVALGRVVAHELVHAMAPEMTHTTAGLMAPVYGRQVLVGPRPRLDLAVSVAYRAGVERWLGPEPGRTDPTGRRFFDLSQGRARAAIVMGLGDVSPAR
jgi:hypothetical protein